MTTATPNPQQLAERRRLADGAKLAPLARFAAIARAAQASDVQTPAQVPGLDYDARTLELTFSSETPVPRWFGLEVLSHDANAANLSRFNDGANVLFNHDMDDVLGVVERAWVGPDRRGHAVVRFGRDARGQWALDQVADGILRNVSFMYQPSDY